MAVIKGIMTGYGAEAVYWRVLPAYTVDHSNDSIQARILGYVSQEQRELGANHMEEKFVVVSPIPEVTIDGVADLRPAIYEALKSGSGAVHNGKLPHEGGGFVSDMFLDAEDA